MKRMILLVALVVCLAMLSGCAGYYGGTLVRPSMGGLYADLTAPISVESDKAGSKCGTAMSSSILGWVATGDSSIETAAKNGGITTISHVDYHFKNILGIYSEFTTKVYGE